MEKKETNVNKTQLVLTELVVPYDRNVRVHKEEQIANIARSIEEFGFNQPIVVDENCVVLVGHGRLEAAKQLGLQKVPVVKVEGLTDIQKRAYRIGDNKLQNDSTWDLFNLRHEFDLFSQETFDFSAYDLKALDDYAAAYKPNLEPEIAPVKPSEEELEKVRSELERQYANNSPQIEVCCPECAATFYIAKN